MTQFKRKRKLCFKHTLKQFFIKLPIFNLSYSSCIFTFKFLAFITSVFQRLKVYFRLFLLKCPFIITVNPQISALTPTYRPKVKISAPRLSAPFPNPNGVVWDMYIVSVCEYVKWTRWTRSVLRCGDLNFRISFLCWCET